MIFFKDILHLCKHVNILMEQMNMTLIPGLIDRILYRANNLNDIIQCKYSSIIDVILSDY